MKNFTKITYFFLLTFGVISCSDDILDKEPLDEISPALLLISEGGFRAALDGVYGVMRDDLLGYNIGIYSIPEAINDDIVVGDPFSFTFDNTHTDIYPLTYDQNNFQPLVFWIVSYKAINNANTIIKAARSSTLENADSFLGEALGLRALLHYNLYRFYAPALNTSATALAIPYRTEEDALLTVNPRNTTQETIDFVLADLVEAEAIATNDVNSFRLSKTAIQALLARVYHETNDFENAITYAESALSDGRFVLNTTVGELENQWRMDESDEIIFRIRFDEMDEPGNAALLAIPDFFSFPYFASDDLIALYDQANDIRFSVYFEPEPFGSPSFYPEKHVGLRAVDPANPSPGITDIKLVRLPELYLILAESYQKEGNSGSATSNLNILRNARGLGDYTGGSLAGEILNERRRELAFEGFRFTDLKRLGLGITRTDGTSLAPNADRFALPIPQLEIDKSGLEQNPGY